MQDLVGKYVFWNSQDVTSLDGYDYIVIGSGCTAIAFIDETLRLDPFKRILCLEKGAFLLPCHYQNLPDPINALYPVESLIDYPWDLSTKTQASDLGFCHGLSTFFGGRSLFWSAWCPQPPLEALRDFPESMLEAARDPEFWNRARDVLEVVSLAEMQDPAFNALQQHLSKKFTLPIKDVPSLVTSKPSSLAIGRKHFHGKTTSAKFSAAESLLALMGRQKTLAASGGGAKLDIGLNFDVQKIEIDHKGRAVGLHTSQGSFSIHNDDKTKVILCAGAIANTTILFNSCPQIHKTAGLRLTGHFLSHITCRFPKSEFSPDIQFRKDGPEIGAHCLLGLHPLNNQQYQIQISAVHSSHPDFDAEELNYKSPDIQASAQRDQLTGSENYVVLACAMLGELSENNPNSWIKPGSPISLQYLPTSSDLETWSFMESTCLTLLNSLSPATIEYWHEDSSTWSKDPDLASMRAKGVVHEASMTFVGEGGSLDEMYRPHGVRSVAVTGNGILPTAGAYNPTLTVCGFAMDLARKLHRESLGDQ